MLPGVRPGGGPVDVTLLPLDGVVPTSGRFKGADGKPLTGIIVRFESGDDAEDAFDARVDREGNLEVSALSPGTYVQSFVEPGSDGRELRVWSRRVRVEDSVADYILRITAETRRSPSLSLGASPRGSAMLYRASQDLGRVYSMEDSFVSLF